MSHKFSFLQVFAGNNFNFSKLLGAYTQDRRLRENQAGLRVDDFRRVKDNALLANLSKYLISIWRIAVIVPEGLAFRCYEPTTGIFRN
ncbi:MAG: hypothetical protein KI793_11805 [Rivularia sp. (in: Bacteria)]|nr:hypothetical protein [Rivularia sp. MS3]